MRRELPRRYRRILLVVHVVVSVGWLGAGAANLVLAIAAAHPSAVPTRAAYQAIDLIDTWAVIPAAFASLATGVALSVFTSWRLTRHWWVLVKFVLTVVVIVASTFVIGARVEEALASPTDDVASSGTVAVITSAAANLVAFVLMTWLSVVKPRGLTPWAADSGRGPARRPAAGGNANRGGRAARSPAAR